MSDQSNSQENSQESASQVATVATPEDSVVGQKAVADWAFEVNHIGQIRLVACKSPEMAIAICNELFGHDESATASRCAPFRRWNNVARAENGAAVYRPWMGKSSEGLK